MARVGPVILSVVGDSFIESVNIRSVVWTGATTAGDTATLTERGTGNILVEFRASGSHTWMGLGLRQSCPLGFRLSQISAGKMFVYLAEPQ